MQKTNPHKKWLIVFVVLAILGVIEIATPDHVVDGLGVISGWTLIGFAQINITIASGTAVAVNTVLAFTIIWIGIALYEYVQYTKWNKKPNNK